MISSNTATITVEEKRFILRCMALIRTALNSEEFPTEVRAKGALTAGGNYSYGNFSIKAGETYDPDILTEVVRTVKYNFTYEKLSECKDTTCEYTQLGD